MNLFPTTFCLFKSSNNYMDFRKELQAMNYNLNKYHLSAPSIALSRNRRYRRKRRSQRLRFLLAAITLSLMIVTINYIFLTFSSKHKEVIPVEMPLNNSLTIRNDQSLDAVTSEPVLDQPKGEEDIGRYDSSAPVQISEAVDASYFDDAVFIGDSRTEGFMLYTGLSNATAYTHKGLMVDTVFTDPVINMGGEKTSVMGALGKTSFSKVYIMFGINETGWPYSNLFIEKYSAIIDEIKKNNSKALIYVQSILPVSQKVSFSHRYVKNTKINEYNLLIQQMAEKKGVYYINSAESVAAPDGYLPEEAASDGIHLKKDYCDKWLEYLKTHTINAQEFKK